MTQRFSGRDVISSCAFKARPKNDIKSEEGMNRWCATVTFRHTGESDCELAINNFAQMHLLWL